MLFNLQKLFTIGLNLRTNGNVVEMIHEHLYVFFIFRILINYIVLLSDMRLLHIVWRCDLFMHVL